jgi:hypothetical protein
MKPGISNLGVSTLPATLLPPLLVLSPTTIAGYPLANLNYEPGADQLINNLTGGLLWKS